MTETNIIDRLFLELSQFTNATTAKELQLQRERHLWQAIAQAAELHILQGDSRPIWAALDSARTAGLKWEDET